MVVGPSSKVFNFSGKIDGPCKVGVGHRHEQPILIVFVFYFEYFAIPFLDLFWHFFGCLRFALFWAPVATFTRNCQKSCICLKHLKRTQKFVTPFHPMINNIIFPLASPEKTRAYPPRQIRVRLLFTHPIVCTISTYADYFVSRWFMKCIAFCGTTPCRRVSSLKFCLAAGGTS